MDNYQFELDGITFGLGAPVAVDGDGFDIGEDNVSHQDVFNRTGQSYWHGEDAAEPAAWSWEMHTDTARFPDDALADIGELERAWKDPSRRIPGTVRQLRYKVANRVRHVYGRCGRWSHTMDSDLPRGLVRVVSEFRRSDTLFYGEEQYTAEIQAQPMEPTGFTTPIITPLTTMVGSLDNPDTATAASAGTVPAPLVVTFHGPTSGSAYLPKISGTGWEIALDLSIEPGETIVVDTHSWAYRAIRHDGANMTGYLTMQSRLDKARIPPEGDTLHFDVTDPTGTARAVVSWYPTYDTI